jgi:hypothetical protein
VSTIETEDAQSREKPRRLLRASLQLAVGIVQGQESTALREALKLCNDRTQWLAARPSRNVQPPAPQQIDCFEQMIGRDSA